MSIRDVKDTLLWIGSSIGKSKNITSLVEETMGKQLIATFGIGMLSCFRVSSKISVASCKENETPLQFSIKDISQTIVPQESDDTFIGSTFYVEFDIDKYSVSIEKMLDTFSFYFRVIHQAELQYMELPFDETTASKTRKEIFTIARSEAHTIGISEPFVSSSLYQKNIVGERYSGVFWICDGEIGDILLKQGKIQILNEGIFVKEDSINNWLPKHMSVFDGMLNISSKVLDLTASRDSIRENEKSTSLRKELRLKSTSLFEGLVKKQAQEINSNKKLSLIIMDILKRAERGDKDHILRKLDSYYVHMSGSNKFMALKYFEDTVYVEYPIGHFVEDLTTFESKQLYHKDIEFAQLQTSLMLQKGETVISAINYDSGSLVSSDALREIDLIKQYCNLKNIKVVDLLQDNVIEGMYRSKKINNMGRDLIGSQVKFVDIPGLPNKKIWVV